MSDPALLWQAFLTKRPDRAQFLYVVENGRDIFRQQAASYLLAHDPRLEECCVMLCRLENGERAEVLTTLRWLVDLEGWSNLRELLERYPQVVAKVWELLPRETEEDNLWLLAHCSDREIAGEILDQLLEAHSINARFPDFLAKLPDDEWREEVKVRVFEEGGADQLVDIAKYVPEWREKAVKDFCVYYEETRRDDPQTLLEMEEKVRELLVVLRDQGQLALADELERRCAAVVWQEMSIPALLRLMI